MKLLSCLLLVTVTMGLAHAYGYYPSPMPVCGCPPAHLVAYEPLCGSNYKTYPNKCELGCDHSQGVGGIYALYKGPCVSPYPPPPPGPMIIGARPPGVGSPA